MKEPVRDLDGVMNWLVVAYNLKGNRHQRVGQIISNALTLYHQKRGSSFNNDIFYVEDDVLLAALREYAGS